MTLSTHEIRFDDKLVVVLPECTYIHTHLKSLHFKSLPKAEPVCLCVDLFDIPCSDVQTALSKVSYDQVPSDITEDDSWKAFVIVNARPLSVEMNDTICDGEHPEAIPPLLADNAVAIKRLWTERQDVKVCHHASSLAFRIYSWAQRKFGYLRGFQWTYDPKTGKFYMFLWFYIDQMRFSVYKHYHYWSPKFKSEYLQIYSKLTEICKLSKDNSSINSYAAIKKTIEKRLEKIPLDDTCTLQDILQSKCKYHNPTRNLYGVSSRIVRRVHLDESLLPPCGPSMSFTIRTRITGRLMVAIKQCVGRITVLRGKYQKSETDLEQSTASVLSQGTPSPHKEIKEVDSSSKTEQKTSNRVQGPSEEPPILSSSPDLPSSTVPQHTIPTEPSCNRYATPTHEGQSTEAEKFKRDSPSHYKQYHPVHPPSHRTVQPIHQPLHSYPSESPSSYLFYADQGYPLPRYNFSGVFPALSDPYVYYQYASRHAIQPPPARTPSHHTPSYGSSSHAHQFSRHIAPSRDYPIQPRMHQPSMPMHTSGGDHSYPVGQLRPSHPYYGTSQSRIVDASRQPQETHQDQRSTFSTSHERTPSFEIPESFVHPTTGIPIDITQFEAPALAPSSSATSSSTASYHISMPSDTGHLSHGIVMEPHGRTSMFPQFPMGSRDSESSEVFPPF
ncbi:hypothetical protein ADUPG1_008629 [Aduncisulcus paluster]|uniref:Uncharacterized protein n=1 Tax=Aduncisulcus paluster TaxID=2918883 RepID=A0ABQ5KUZ5_9EUKA|nr:hypothetical protein ADUPG1_008629 [Aduncisulcus paluster]